MHSYKDGSALSVQPLWPYCDETYNAPYLLVHRADFHAILAEAAISLGVTIRLKSPVETVDFSAPALILENGDVVKGDAVIAADGLRSVCREALLGRKDPPIPSGSLAYRITLDPGKMRLNEDLRDLVNCPEFHCWIGNEPIHRNTLHTLDGANKLSGPHGHGVFYPIRKGELCNLVVVAPDDLPEFEDSAAANISEIREFFKSWESRLQKLMDMVTSTAKWKLQDNVELERWSSDEGTFTMLGDACHATIPYL
jgi:salicylate hydroxylase